jgi:UDP-N-acetylmuramyl pentapeptide phosphotransferase/UDP-N-acetylglucosamine-1-phosphate transferase
MNAVNLVDGMDGLAAGVGFFATVTTLIAALIHQNLELAIVTVPMAGALLGFLRYNFNPASIFLGDSGSLLVGLLLGCYAALWSQKSATMLGMAAPLMALAIPLLETSLSILRRALRNRPVFGADAGHIHHKLLEQGLTPEEQPCCCTESAPWQPFYLCCMRRLTTVRRSRHCALLRGIVDRNPAFGLRRNWGWPAGCSFAVP